MRLRSSQFVFLMLLVCSVQIQEEYALHLMAGVVSGRTAGASQLREVSSASTKSSDLLSANTEHAARPIQLDAASLAAHRIPWSMRSPALEATTLASFTGFFRA